MRLVCLGTAGYHPSEQRHTSCYLIPEAGIVLDAGTGMFRLAEHLTTNELDILLSHPHLDHVVGLTYLLDVLVQRPLRKIRVWGMSRYLEAVHEHVFHEMIFPVMPPIEWCPLVDVCCTLPAVPQRPETQLTWFTLDHPGGSTGFRLDWPGRSLAYITDTTADRESAYISQIMGVDLLMHEANFRDDQRSFAEQTGHSTVGNAIQIAARCEARRLLLIHQNPLEDGPGSLNLSSIGPGGTLQVSVASDGLTMEF